MDETKRESTPQEWEIDIMERYARLMGNKYLLRETVAALLLDATSMMLEDAEARAIEEKHILDDWEFQVMRVEKRGRDFEMIPEGGGTR